MNLRLWTLVIASLTPTLAPADEASVDRELLAYAQPWVRRLSRDVHVYHWAPRANVGDRNDKRPLTALDPRAKHYLNYLKEQFWTDNNATNSVMGHGVYAAIDPVITAGYGSASGMGLDLESTDWALMQIVIPKDTQFLALPSLDSLSTPSTTLVQGLAKLNCPVGSLNRIFSSANNAAPCKAVRDRLVQRLDVQALRYQYASMEIPVCVPVRDPWAFVLFDGRALNLDRLVVFTPQLPARPDAQSENRLLIQGIFDSVANASGLPPGFPWPALTKQKPKTDLAAWAKSNLANCADYPEDK